MDANNWIALAVLALGVVAALITLLRYLTQQLDQERRWREEADTKIDGRLTAFQLEAVRTYATAGAIEKSEERLAAALEKLTGRLETVITRIETLGTELARIAVRQAT